MSIDSSATGNKEKSFSTFRMVCYKITVHASKRLIAALKLTHAELKKKLSNTNYWLNRGGPALSQDAFYEDYAEDLRDRRRQNWKGFPQTK